jgi:uncharacterized linocin/CFP29 family protein
VDAFELESDVAVQALPGGDREAEKLRRQVIAGSSVMRPGSQLSFEVPRQLRVWWRGDFELLLSELRDADRGADDADLTALDNAARQIAVAENIAVFHGWADQITGITQASSHDPQPLGEPESYPAHVAAAVERLLAGGVGGPYGLALGSDAYRVVLGTAEHGGYPLRDHLSKVIEGPLVYAPGVRGAVLVSQRGGDFIFDCGQDISIGWQSHDNDAIRLYLQESFSFHVATSEASVAFSTAG